MGFPGSDATKVRLRALAAIVALVGSKAPATAASPTDLVGTWKGTARLSTDATPACEYVGGFGAGGVSLQVVAAGQAFRGNLSVDLTAPTGPSCPPLSVRQDVSELTVTESSVSFVDPSGLEWNLGLRGGALQGMVASRGAAAAGAGAGLPPLSGEVNLRRAAGDRAARPAAGPSAPAAPASQAARKGSGLGGVAAIVAANVVGVGGFVLVNVLADDSGQQTQGAATCSPRVCFFEALTDPCTCNIDVVAGASCGLNPGGIPVGGSCNSANRPCQAGLSCNNGICDDRAGRCPF